MQGHDHGMVQRHSDKNQYFHGRFHRTNDNHSHEEHDTTTNSYKH